MADISRRKYQDKLPNLKKHVETAYGYFDKNYSRFYEFCRYIFRSAISDDQLAALSALGKPPLEFNFNEAYISRLCGEFSKQEPSINVRMEDGITYIPGLTETVEGICRNLITDSANDSMAYEIYRNMLAGGFSVAKVYTKYKERKFDQTICVEKCADPTLCGFDPVAHTSHKGDGRFSFENFPKLADEVKSLYGSDAVKDVKFSRNNIGDFSWSYTSQRSDKILLLCDFYEKKIKTGKIVQLASGQVLTEKDYEDFMERYHQSGIIYPPPAVIKSREDEFVTICHYTFVENKILDYEETDLKYLPHVFFDGNSIMLRESKDGSVYQMTRPYVYHIKGLQDLKNFAGQTLAAELENTIAHKIKAAEEALPDPGPMLDAYTNLQKAQTLVYKAFKDEDPNQPLPPPQEIVRTPIPPEISNTFASTDSLAQSILGSYDASLGVNDNQLSGVAIVEGATQSNSAAMPYIVGYLKGLNQIAKIIVDLIPKYYVTPMSVPVTKPDGKKSYQIINHPKGISLAYDSNDLVVTVEAGVNFAVQKSRALQQIIAMMQASPLFAQFMNANGLNILLENLEVRGIDQIKAEAEAFMAQMKQQQSQASQQPNPEMIKMQIEMQKVQMQLQKIQMDMQLEQQKMQLDAQTEANKNAIDKQNADTNLLQVLGQMDLSKDQLLVEQDKAEAEKSRAAVDLALKVSDQHHAHAKEAVELHHTITQGALENERKTNEAKNAQSQNNGQ